MLQGYEMRSVMLRLLNTVLQHCTCILVRLNIQCESTYSITVEFNCTMALEVLMEQCNFVSAGTETTDFAEATVYYTL